MYDIAAIVEQCVVHHYTADVLLMLCDPGVMYITTTMLPGK